MYPEIRFRDLNIEDEIFSGVAKIRKFRTTEKVQKAWENGQTNFNTGLPMRQYLDSVGIRVDIIHLQQEHILWAAHSSETSGCPNFDTTAGNAAFVDDGHDTWCVMQLYYEDNL